MIIDRSRGHIDPILRIDLNFLSTQAYQLWVEYPLRFLDERWRSQVGPTRFGDGLMTAIFWMGELKGFKWPLKDEPENAY